MKNILFLGKRGREHGFVCKSNIVCVCGVDEWKINKFFYSVQILFVCVIKCLVRI